MNAYRRFLLFFLVMLLLSSCASLQAANLPVAMAPPVNTARPTYILEVPGATPTPTPFQPVPPTPISLPEGEPTPTPTPLVFPTPTIEPDTEEQESLTQPFGQVNILLLGTDARPWSTNFRTDTIILITLNSELGRVNVTSFPRDLYITLPGHGLNRINTAYTYGKYKLLSDTFEYNFGVRPDHYVLVNFQAFKRIIDSLEGLEVNVAQPVSDYRAGYWVTIPVGEVHMDADLALWYVRSRKTSNDLARNRRQQEVLEALFRKLLSINGLRRVPEFYKLYTKNVETDITLVDVLTWLPLAARVAESGEIHQYYINYNHVTDWWAPGGAMVLLPNRQAVMQVIRKSQNLP